MDDDKMFRMQSIIRTQLIIIIFRRRRHIDRAALLGEGAPGNDWMMLDYLLIATPEIK